MRDQWPQFLDSSQSAATRSTACFEFSRKAPAAARSLSSAHPVDALLDVRSCDGPSDFQLSLVRGSTDRAGQGLPFSRSPMLEADGSSCCTSCGAASARRYAAAILSNEAANAITSGSSSAPVDTPYSVQRAKAVAARPMPASIRTKQSMYKQKRSWRRAWLLLRSPTRPSSTRAAIAAQERLRARSSTAPQRVSADAMSMTMFRGARDQAASISLLAALSQNRSLNGYSTQV